MDHIDMNHPRLTSLSHGAGCACKLSLDELGSILRSATSPPHTDLLVGNATGDDAAVWARPDGRALVATTDFFTPIVDDPRDWGRIAAANAASDVYAMGGMPLFALNLVGWPRALPFELLDAVLNGAREIADEAGYVIAGGHSIDSAEPLYGQVVIGEVSPDALLTNAGGQSGHDLVLTKAIGTGIATTAWKRSDPSEMDGDDVRRHALEHAVESMTTLNATAAAAAVEANASAATDVTGFGLLGHLHRLCLASGVSAEIDAASVPVLPGVPELLRAGHVAGGTQRNADQVRSHVMGDPDPLTLTLLADAQTSGGLLIACPPQACGHLVTRLRGTGHDAARIGRLVAGRPGQITVRA